MSGSGCFDQGNFIESQCQGSFLDSCIMAMATFDMRCCLVGGGNGAKDQNIQTFLKNPITKERLVSKIFKVK